MLHTTDATIEIRELTDCRIFGTLTGAVHGGGDTRQHAQKKLFLAAVMRKLLDRSNRCSYTLEDYFGNLHWADLIHLLQHKEKN